MIFSLHMKLPELLYLCVLCQSINVDKHISIFVDSFAPVWALEDDVVLGIMWYE